MINQVTEKQGYFNVFVFLFIIYLFMFQIILPLEPQTFEKQVFQ